MTGWAEPALRLLLDRVGQTVEHVGDRFPLFADPDTGTWTTTARGSWAGGFWAGLLALRAAAEPGAGRLAEALAARERLASWVHADTGCRGMIFWYGDTAGWLGLAEPAATTVAAARALAAGFDPRVDAVPWGTALAPGPDPLALKPDGAAGVVPLLAWARHRPGGPPDGTRLAHRHLAAHLRLGRQRWSRGAAWLLLAAADAELHDTSNPDPPCPDPDRPCATSDADRPCAARRLAADWLGRFGTGLPTAHQGRPGAPPDSSAAAIAAVALLTLATLDDDPRWRRAGTDLLAEVAHTAQRGSGPGAGGVGLGCYDLAGGTATAHELIWGDYFTALGLAMLTGLTEPSRWPARPPRPRHAQTAVGNE